MVMLTQFHSYENITSVNQPEGSVRVLNNAETSASPTFAEPEENEISLLDLLIVIVRSRWLILKVTIGFALAAAFGSHASSRPMNSGRGSRVELRTEEHF